MSEALTNENGEFELSGNDTEWTKIDPKLNIYHNCHDEAIVSFSNLFRKNLFKMDFIIHKTYTFAMFAEAAKTLLF